MKIQFEFDVGELPAIVEAISVEANSFRIEGPREFGFHLRNVSKSLAAHLPEVSKLFAPATFWDLCRNLGVAKKLEISYRRRYTWESRGCILIQIDDFDPLQTPTFDLDLLPRAAKDMQALVLFAKSLAPDVEIVES